MSGTIVTSDRLESWKEIASWVGKTERTAKRWERERGLPVHRVPGGGRQVVFAYRHELDAWLNSGGTGRTAEEHPTEVAFATIIPDSPLAEMTRHDPLVRFRARAWLPALGGAVAIILAIGTIAAFQPSGPDLTATTPVRISRSQTQILSPLFSDGARIYYPRYDNGQLGIGATPVQGGESTPIPSPIRNPELCDLDSSSHAMVLRSIVHSRDALNPVYIQSSNATAKRIENFMAYDAAWYPRVKRILYSVDGKVYGTDSDGVSRKLLFTVPGNAYWFRWSPNGRKLRFTVINERNEETSLWEYEDGDTEPHKLFPKLPLYTCCGSWTPDGKYYLFQVRDGSTFQIWARRELNRFHLPIPGKPFSLLFGASSYRGPVTSLDGKKLFVRAEQPKAELVRYDAQAKAFLPVLPSVSVRTPAFSRDGAWIAFTSLSDNNLWRCHADGTDCLQLTQTFRNTMLPRWSPDGRTIVFMGTPFNGKWGIYAIPASSGTMRALSDSNQAQGDPDWSPEGNRLVYSEVLPLAQPSGIHILDLRTNSVSTLPNSIGYFSPRWSPDGRYIVTLRIGDHSLWLFDFVSRQWRRLADLQSGYPNWSHDGKYVFFLATISGKRTIFRVAVAGNALEKVTNLENVERGPFFMSDWIGLANDDTPLAIQNLTTEDIYAWDIAEKGF